MIAWKGNLTDWEGERMEILSSPLGVALVNGAFLLINSVILLRVARNVTKIEKATNSMMATREAAAVVKGHAEGVASEKLDQQRSK